MTPIIIKFLIDGDWPEGMGIFQMTSMGGHFTDSENLSLRYRDSN